MSLNSLRFGVGILLSRALIIAFVHTTFDRQRALSTAYRCRTSVVIHVHFQRPGRLGEPA